MAGIGSDSQLYEDTFKIDSINDEKYDRASRLFCTSLDGTTVMSLDINHELFPCRAGETLHVVLATTLSLDGIQDDERGWRDVAKSGEGVEATLADMFDYVCHGKIYRFDDGEDGQTMYVRPEEQASQTRKK
jgi:DNA-directed RNA polymerase I, II, and III subunit RPABC3